MTCIFSLLLTFAMSLFCAFFPWFNMGRITVIGTC
jgi:hypothetical protein